MPLLHVISTLGILFDNFRLFAIEAAVLAVNPDTQRDAQCHHYQTGGGANPQTGTVVWFVGRGEDVGACFELFVSFFACIVVRIRTAGFMLFLMHRGKYREQGVCRRYRFAHGALSLFPCITGR
jgi:hypothetical protein